MSFACQLVREFRRRIGFVAAQHGRLLGGTLGIRDGRCVHDCCRLSQAHRGMVTRAERARDRGRARRHRGEILRRQRAYFHAWRCLRLLDRHRHGSCADGTVSSGGKAASFAGLTAGAWFGEGSVLKNEARRYDVVALRDTRLALTDRTTFFWLFENSVGFNRFLVRQLNERLGQFIGALEIDRTLDATGRVARSIASLFNPILYPDLTRHLEVTQEEIGALSGISRQNANQCLKRLEKEGVLRLEYGGVTILELERLRHYGE